MISEFTINIGHIRYDADDDTYTIVLKGMQKAKVDNYYDTWIKYQIIIGDIREIISRNSDNAEDHAVKLALTEILSENGIPITTSND
jgi:hypothetical protein